MRDPKHPAPKKFVVERWATAKLLHNYGTTHSPPNRSDSPCASAYHNPGSTLLNLAVHGITDGECTLLNITGRTVANQKLQDGKATIPTFHLPPGVYAYTVTQAGIRLAFGKWVKE